ncbi:uncharacterized protein LAESUDRAFT_730753, partial [Laetiporus sulphureus 93-53]
MGLIFSCIAGICVGIGSLALGIVAVIGACLEFIASLIVGCATGICECVTAVLCCGCCA